MRLSFPPARLEVVAALDNSNVITAAADAGASDPPKLRNFSMIGYTGGAMRAAGFGLPVVVDLAGLKVTNQQTPILLNHDTEREVGHSTSVEKTPQQLKLSGVISGVGPHVEKVVQMAGNKFPWQASIGASIEGKLEFIDAKTKVNVNGRAFEGPLYVARQTELREVSFVPLGADSATSASVAATLDLGGRLLKGSAMTLTFDMWTVTRGFDNGTLTAAQRSTLQAAYDAEVKAGAITGAAGGDGASEDDDAAAVARRRAALLAEEDRVAQIRAIDRIDSAIVKAAIAQGWTVEKAKAASFDLNAVRDARPTFNGSFAIHSHGPESMQPRVVEAAFAIAGKLKDIEKHYDVRTLEAAHQQYRGKASIQEVLLEAAAKNGHQVRPSQVTADLKNVLKAAFSTNSLPGILSNVANKQIAAGFMAVESTWRRISYVRPVNDFKTVTSHRLTGDLKYQQVAPDGELKHGKLGEESFENKANTYGRILSLTRTDIVNDDLGALTKVPQMLGRGAALAINDIFWREFLEHADFFKTANKNYITGAGTVLSIDGLTQLETAFLDQVDDNGDPLAIDPKILLVPNALKATADQLMTSTQIVYGGETAKGANNPHAGKFTVEKSSYLNNPNFAGGSATAYYLLADPQEIAAIEVVFLNGREEPIVESADADFNVLGIDMRGYHDFGVKKQDHRGAAKSKGAA